MSRWYIYPFRFDRQECSANFNRTIARETVYFEESILEGKLKEEVYECGFPSLQHSALPSVSTLLIVLERCCAQNNQNTVNLLYHIWI